MSHKKYCQFASLLYVLAISACAPTSQLVENHSYRTELSGLEIDKSYLPTQVYVRPGSEALSDYNRFIVDPVQVVYDDPDMKELEPETILKMQAYFQEALVTALKAGGYKVGTRAEPKTLRISLHLSGLKAPTSAVNITALAAPFIINVGEVTVEAHFREAISNRLDIVAVASTRGSRVLNTKPWSTWADVEQTFDLWVEGIKEAIDKAHN